VKESVMIGWVHARPFEAFRLSLSNGQSSEVTHPESVMLGDYGLTLTVFHPAGRVEMIDCEHIASIQSISPVDPTPYLR
jgi:hypothetical protein